MSYARSTSISRAGRVGAAVLATVALGAGSLGLTAPSASAAGSDTSFPIPPTQEAPRIVAASGSGLLIDSEGDDQDVYRASGDDGATWVTPDLPGITDGGDHYGISAGGGRMWWAARDGGHYTVYAYDFSTDTTTTLAQLDQRPDELNQTVALQSVAGDNDDVIGFAATNLGTLAQTTLDFAPHSLSGGGTVQGYLGSGSHAFVASIPDRPGTGYLDVLPLDGGARTSAKISGLAAADVRGDQVVYLTETKSETDICFRAASTWSSPACRTLKKGDLRAFDVNLSASADWAVVTVYRWQDKLQFAVEGTTAPAAPTQVALPDGAKALDLYGAGDSARPFADVADADGGYVAAYRSDGTFKRLFDYDTAGNWLRSFGLTTGRMVGADSRPTYDNPGYQTWSRSVTDGVAGEEQLFAPRASGGVAASDARTVIASTTGVKLFDRGTQVRTLPGDNRHEIGALSGVYYIDSVRGRGEVRRIDGTRMLKAPVLSIFGSLALKKVKRGSYQVIDVTGATPTVKVTIPAAQKSLIADLDQETIWGDWMVAADSEVDNGVVLAMNYRTGKVVTHMGYLRAVGDGFAVIDAPGDAHNSLALWDFTDLDSSTNTQTILEDSESIRDAVTDGSHLVAYDTDTDVVLHPVSGVGKSQPRLLGLVAPGTLNNRPSSAAWTLQIDATKALGQGTLTIRNSKKAVVRTITVNATEDGSIRDLSWNGRDEGGTAVPAGTYSWELAVPAADGTGNLVKVNGKSGLSGGAQGIAGTLKVKPAYLGTVSGSTPKLSSTRPVVDQQLKVTLGNWKPAGSTTFSYQWYRGSKPIAAADGGTSDTYTVGAADVGQKLKVAVTGAADGWKSTVKTSAATAKVIAAP